MQKISKRSAIQGGLLLGYLSVWFVFGVTYKWVADSSAGDAFTFQEDLRLRSQAEAFVRSAGASTPARRARDLVRAHDERLLLNFNDTPGPLSNLPLGREWALFYEDKLRAEGFSWFFLRELPSEPYPLARVLQDITVLQTAPPQALIKPPEARPFLLQLYKGPPEFDSIRSSGARDRPPQREMKVWSTALPEALTPFPVQPMTFFAQDARHFLNFIDSSPNVLERVLSGRYDYPLLDFLYFSAITIGTVGYGDILPNRTDVRVLVMIEVFAGIVLAGAFVSSLFMQRTPPQPHKDKDGRVTSPLRQ